MVGSENDFFSKSAFWPFKVIQGHWFWHLSKARIYDFLLGRHSNVGPILHRFRDIAGFFALMTPPLIFWAFPLHQIAHVGVNLSRPKAIRPWNYFWSIPTCVKNIPQRSSQEDRRTDRQTDGRTDRQMTCCGITSLCIASRGNNNNNKKKKKKKAELSQRWPRDAPYIWCPENFRESLSTPTATFAEIFNGLLFRSILWMRVRYEIWSS